MSSGSGDAPPDLFHQIYRVRHDRFVFVDHAPSKVKRGGGRWHAQSFLDHFKVYVAAARLYKQNPSIVRHLAALPQAVLDADEWDAKIAECATTDSELERRMRRYYTDVAAEEDSLLVPNNAWEAMGGSGTDDAVAATEAPVLSSGGVVDHGLDGRETSGGTTVVCTTCFAQPCSCPDWGSEVYDDPYSQPHDDPYDDRGYNDADYDNHYADYIDPSNPEDA